MQNFSYHTHTVFSDGHNTIEEMLDRAEELGWREIGISDHLIVHKNITRSRSFPRWMNSPNNHVYRTGFVAAAEDFARHAENVRRAARGRRLKVKVGAEVDWFVYEAGKKSLPLSVRNLDSTIIFPAIIFCSRRKVKFWISRIFPCLPVPSGRKR